MPVLSVQDRVRWPCCEADSRCKPHAANSLFWLDRCSASTQMDLKLGWFVMQNSTTGGKQANSMQGCLVPLCKDEPSAHCLDVLSKLGPSLLKLSFHLVCCSKWR